MIVKKGGGGAFEAHFEQPVLSPTTVEEAAPALVRVEERGKRRATSEENSNSKWLTLMKEMRQRDGQIREELRWWETHFDEELKKREK